MGLGEEVDYIMIRGEGLDLLSPIFCNLAGVLEFDFHSLPGSFYYVMDL